jgi:FO synthase subunit 1
MTSIPGEEEYDINLDIAIRDVEEILDVRPADVSEPAELTFAKNIFLPLTTACRYTCTYCTYFEPPGEASLLSSDEVREQVSRGADAGCTEALFTFGDEPDDRYTQIHDQLAQWGHDSIHSYLREVCQIALDEGLLPHSNPGDQTREQMAQVADLNASMGVMLETTADVDAHAGARTKVPGQRLNTIRNAGELSVPFTTGILVGIGETWTDRAESLLAIQEMHERYGHIQEVIIQPVVNNDRWDSGSPDVETLRRVVAMARVALEESISVQVPPNLAPVRDVIDCGVDDLGGVSPVTDDYINPEYEWPALRELKAIADDASLPLSERLPVHERFIDTRDSWLSSSIQTAIRGDDEPGTRYRRVLNGLN